ncbi:hypothetical protein SAMN04488063_0321 [Halopelagius inordinatus]|uniref:Uncharacterized protein n=1 Tax=Halopelagius inordinatus TaxID=553467 RepID=A0A1I2LKN4_9EURY|nr:hypothetical protein SAMN04488063_0321 [Halopelagius inordinatus]
MGVCDNRVLGRGDGVLVTSMVSVVSSASDYREPRVRVESDGRAAVGGKGRGE